jgi:hypothetical protein
VRGGLRTVCNNDRVLNDEERPILTGLVALVSVALAVGLIVGISALVGTKVLGLGGDDHAVDSGGGATLYLPTPQKTEAPSGPLITLAPGEPTPSGTSSVEPSDSATAKPKTEISLSASQTAVAKFEQIDLTGVYVGGEGAILQVQRLEDGSWQDFPETVSDSDSTFSTYVQTSRPGINEFRVIDLDSKRHSNSVRVKIS